MEVFVKDVLSILVAILLGGLYFWLTSYVGSLGLLLAIAAAFFMLFVGALLVIWGVLDLED